MGMFFIRSASLQIGTNRYSMDDGFFFEFEIPFYDSEELTTVSFKIHNLSEGTRKSIARGLPVILNAGYEGPSSSGKSTGHPAGSRERNG